MTKAMMGKPMARAAQAIGSAGIGLFCLWLLSRHIPDALTMAFWRAVLDEMRHLPPAAVALAALCVGTSFWAVGRYDAVAHRHFRTGIPARHAGISGTVAIALSQTLGLGVLTGAVIRWRMMRHVSFGLALKLSAFVSLTFAAALAIVAAAACLILQTVPSLIWPASAVILGGAALLAMLFLFPTLRFRSRRIALPSLRAAGSILLWTVIDTCAAATALYLLMHGADISFALLLPAFLLALGAALVSGTPGGVGPFELVLFALLPDAVTIEALSGLIAFRALYYALPAMIAAFAILRPFRDAQPPAQIRPLQSLADAHRAEIGVIRQNGGSLLPLPEGAAAVWPAGQTLCALFDPIGRAADDLPRRLGSAAHAANLLPLLYKCSARTALAARRQGWRTLHIADEAWLDPAAFDLSAAPCRSLRRKLRSAKKAALRVASPAPLPLEAMMRIDAAWCAERGGARGGTMGYFCPDYLNRQQVFVACQGGSPVAFVSFHVTRHEWCLDLMRQSPQAPDGTMHLLIHHAIQQAAQTAIPRVSLAAIPACPDPTSSLWRAIARQVVRRSGGPGLRQFKSAFNPNWQPLYAAAPTTTALALGLADIARAVHRPDQPQAGRSAHQNDENYEVASVLAS